MVKFANTELKAGKITLSYTYFMVTTLSKAGKKSFGLEDAGNGGIVSHGQRVCFG